MSYIVPMKKPICINCPFRSLDNCTLIFLMSDKDGEVTVYVNTMTVSPDCPLVEIPTQHSDLVDRNKLLAEYDRQHKGPAGGARRIMEQADAVIEAEGSGI